MPGRTQVICDSTESMPKTNDQFQIKCSIRIQSRNRISQSGLVDRAPAPRRHALRQRERELAIHILKKKKHTYKKKPNKVHVIAAMRFQNEECAYHECKMSDMYYVFGKTQHI